MKKILITGASGFIGSFLVDEALKNNYQVWAGIRKSSSLRFLPKEKIELIDLNYANKTILEKQLKDHVLKHGKWDYIIHNAGITKALHLNDFDYVNTQYCKNLVDTLHKLKITPNKFLLMSSLSAFGPIDESCSRPISLSDTPNPTTAYGKSKLHAEKYLKSLPQFPYIILRPTGVYGPRDKDYLQVIKIIKKGFKFGIGFKKQFLTFIYVKDLAKACFLALESPLKQKEYFVSDGDFYSDKAYTSILCRILNKKRVINCRIPLFILYFAAILCELTSKIIGKPFVLNRDKYQILKQRNWCCDDRLIQKDLSFTAEYNLTKGMQESIEWYKKNDWL